MAAVVFISSISALAQGTGAAYVLFPELGALSHDVFKRPEGNWAKAPLMLVATPSLAAIAGTLVARNFDYGLVSVLLTIGSAILIIRLLRSPIAPAISASLLPLTLNIDSGWYPLAIAFGTGALVILSLLRGRFLSEARPGLMLADIADDAVEETPSNYSWIAYFLSFLILSVLVVDATGWRLFLFPPLVVIGFEMFAHPSQCPWAERSLVLPLACALTASCGLAFVMLFGVGPLAAACSMTAGILILRAFDLHVPPALAVGLLPLVVDRPDIWTPVAIGLGTLTLTSSFLLWRRSQMVV